MGKKSVRPKTKINKQREMEKRKRKKNKNKLTTLLIIVLISSFFIRKTPIKISNKPSVASVFFIM